MPTGIVFDLVAGEFADGEGLRLGMGAGVVLVGASRLRSVSRNVSPAMSLALRWAGGGYPWGYEHD